MVGWLGGLVVWCFGSVVPQRHARDVLKLPDVLAPVAVVDQHIRDAHDRSPHDQQCFAHWPLFSVRAQTPPRRRLPCRCRAVPSPWSRTSEPEDDLDTVFVNFDLTLLCGPELVGVGSAEIRKQDQPVTRHDQRAEKHDPAAARPNECFLAWQ